MASLALCKIPNLLAYLALIYILASVYYLIKTRNIGQPLTDAINQDPKLRQMRDYSKKRRKSIFYTGIIVSTVLMTILQPFRGCTCDINQ